MKAYIGVNLIGGLTVMEEVTGEERENLLKMTEEERLQTLWKNFEQLDQRYIIHGSQLIYMKNILTVFVEIRGNLNSQN
jgi:hypothetical protein